MRCQRVRCGAPAALFYRSTRTLVFIIVVAIVVVVVVVVVALRLLLIRVGRVGLGDRRLRRAALLLRELNSGKKMLSSHRVSLLYSLTSPHRTCPPTDGGLQRRLRRHGAHREGVRALL